MDTINYFITETDLPQQNSDGAYGPMESSQYRVTSIFNGDADVMAYAVSNGEVFIVDQADNPARVNLFLRPDSIPVGIPVKYFVYRGLLKSDFLDENNSYEGMKPTGSDDSDFIKNLRKGQNGENALNLHNDLADDYFIDNLFVSDDYQFGLVKQGDSMGRFDSRLNYGFEIMLDETFFTPTLEVARIDENIVKISVNDAEASRLQVLNYIDPAAYYGLFSHSAYSIGTNNNSPPKSRTKDGVYEFIKQFHTKNTVYIDIRDVYENPLDWFGDGPQTIKLTTDGMSSAIDSTEIPYRGSDAFPIKILTGNFTNPLTININQKYYVLKLSLPITGNATPILTLHCGYWLRFVSEILDDMIFSVCSILNPDWSDDKIFVIFGAMDNGTYVPVASYLRLQIGQYFDINTINNQIPNGDSNESTFDVPGLFPFHTNGPPEYQEPIN